METQRRISLRRIKREQDWSQSEEQIVRSLPCSYNVWESSLFTSLPSHKSSKGRQCCPSLNVHESTLLTTSLPFLPSKTSSPPRQRTVYTPGSPRQPAVYFMIQLEFPSFFPLGLSFAVGYGMGWSGGSRRESTENKHLLTNLNLERVPDDACWRVGQLTVSQRRSCLLFAKRLKLRK